MICGGQEKHVSTFDEIAMFFADLMAHNIGMHGIRKLYGIEMLL